jgi:hypothetical protein
MYYMLFLKKKKKHVVDTILLKILKANLNFKKINKYYLYSNTIKILFIYF